MKLLVSDDLAQEWWDPRGPMRALHRLNPVRLAYIRDRLCSHFGRESLRPKPLAGLRLLDIGCGAGLLTEPLHRLGADVVGVDAAAEVIDVARHHADLGDLDIDYRRMTAEELADRGERFDAVVCDGDPRGMSATLVGSLARLARWFRARGALLAATLNRTLKAFAFAIVGAEWVVGWLPRGTHQWDKFVRPSELARELRRSGFRLGDVTGVSYDVVTDGWRTGGDTDVNYLVFATKP